MRGKLTGSGRSLGLGGLAVSIVTGVTALTAGGAASAAQHGSSPPARTPIKHVVVIIGENHSFDNVYATYQAPKGQHVRNLLSEGIITRSGGLGPNRRKAAQLKALNTRKYTLHPKITGAYKTLPRPNTTYVSPGCD